MFKKRFVLAQMTIIQVTFLKLMCTSDTTHFKNFRIHKDDRYNIVSKSYVRIINFVNSFLIIIFPSIVFFGRNIHFLAIMFLKIFEIVLTHFFIT